MIKTIELLKKDDEVELLKEFLIIDDFITHPDDLCDYHEVGKRFKIVDIKDDCYIVYDNVMVYHLDIKDINVKYRKAC